MKKFILLFLTFALVLGSCGIGHEEKLGTVTITFGSANTARAVSSGLPDLATSNIIVTAADYGSKTLLQKVSSQSGRVTMRLPVGKKIVLTAQIKTPAVTWKGSAIHTVLAGNNNVSLKISKKAVGFANFLFSVNEEADGSQNFILGFEGAPRGGFKIDGVEADEKDGIRPVFARDNIGRTYVYSPKRPDGVLKRFDRDGNEDTSFQRLAAAILSDGSPHNILLDEIAADPVTGSVYFFGERSKLKVLKKDGDEEKVISVDLINFQRVDNIAAYGDKLFIIENYNNAEQYKFFAAKLEKLPSFTGLTAVKTAESSSGFDFPVWKLPKQGGEFSTRAEIRDIFIRENEESRGTEIYIAFAAPRFRESNGLFASTGGIVKFTFTGENFIKNAAYGITSANPDNKLMLKTGDENFYGAVKFIGYENNVLYAADDGIRYELNKGKARITENINRIAGLNLSNGKLSFKDVPTSVKWFAENELWKKNLPRPFVFFQMEWKKIKPNEGDYGNMLTKFYVSENDKGTNAVEVLRGKEYLCRSEDFDYAFDKDNNLYLINRNENNEVILKFVKNADGSYKEAETSFTTDQDLSGLCYDEVEERLYTFDKSKDRLTYLSTGDNWHQIQGDASAVGYHKYAVYGDKVYIFNDRNKYAVYNIIEYNTKFDPSPQGTVTFESADETNALGVFAADGKLFIIYSKNVQGRKLFIKTIDISDNENPKQGEASEVKIKGIDYSPEFKKIIGYRDGKLYFALSSRKGQGLESVPYIGIYDGTKVSFESSIPLDLTWHKGN